jgi:glycosyltransferase A (GT-A) superfamily protein (DUF2064 family)
MEARTDSPPPSSDAHPDAARATLLVFTLGPDAEGRRRRLLPRRFGDRERALHRLCLDEALAAAESAGCRLAVSSPAPLALPDGARAVAQRGAGFGERLAAAFDEALDPPHGDRAGRALVTVGTDTPGLRREHVARALELLGDGPGADRRVVVGPSPDGGLYLLAARRPLGTLLRRVAWCRKSTLASLLAVLGDAGLAVELMEPLADLDRPEDLERWLARRAGDVGDGAAAPMARLTAILGRLLATWRRPPVARPAHRPRLAYVPVASGRSPPRVSHRPHR